MQIISKTTKWFQEQVVPKGDDFTQKSEEPKQPSPYKTVAISTGIGGSVGAAIGGGAAYRSLSNDSTFFSWESESVPLASSGPTPQEVFGAELGTFQSAVTAQSQGTSSSQETLQYLSYLKFNDPKLSAADLQGIYTSLEGRFGDDAQVRTALNMISAHMDKYQTTANEAHAEFSNYFGYEEDFDSATQMFLQDQKLTPEELEMTTVQMVEKHTSPIGHLGMAKGLALGVAAGLATGAVTGFAVGMGINLYRKIAGGQ